MENYVRPAYLVNFRHEVSTGGGSASAENSLSKVVLKQVTRAQLFV